MDTFRLSRSDVPLAPDECQAIERYAANKTNPFWQFNVVLAIFERYRDHPLAPRSPHMQFAAALRDQSYTNRTYWADVLQESPLVAHRKYCSDVWRTP